MKKVDVMIGGMQKGGTTALAHYLELHPRVESHPQMEMSYFYDFEEYSKGWKTAKKKYFFDCELERGSKLLLAKHATLIVSKEALKRLLNHNPDIKLLLTFRNPVDRAWSSFLMEVGQGESINTFATAAEEVIQNQKIDSSDWRQGIYFGFGIYTNFLDLVYQVFPENQVKVIFLEELQNRPKQVLEDVFSWLGITITGYDYAVTSTKVNAYAAPKSQTLSRMIKKVFANDNPAKVLIKKLIHPKLQHRLGEGLRNLNKRPASSPKMDQQLRKSLHEFYSPYNKQLAERLNKDLSFWNS